MNENDRTTTELQSFEEKRVFDFLSSGKTEGVLGETMEKMAATAGIHKMQDLQNLVAISRPGPLAFWEAYLNNAPCTLPEAAKIAESTNNVLLYVEQLEEALQMLTGCTSEEATEFRKGNSSIKTNPISRDFLLKQIAEHRGVSQEVAKDIFDRWFFFAKYVDVHYSQAEEKAKQIYSKALEHLNAKK